MKILANIGDYLRIPLPDGRLAYGQYLHFHPLYATLVRITDLVTFEDAAEKAIIAARDLFPPVFVGINVPLRQKLWTIVANRPITNFQMPLFKCRQGLEREAGRYKDWLLWDGKDYIPIGALPPEYRKLEYLVGWSSDGLEKRIATGINEPYGSML
jgi:hypothetical protein